CQRCHHLSQAVFILACSVRGSSAEERCVVACLGGNTFQTASSPWWRIFSSEQSFPSTTLGIAHFRPSVWSGCHCKRTPTILFSTIRSSSKSSPLVAPSERGPAQLVTSPTRA